jgi:hypothetical protein
MKKSARKNKVDPAYYDATDFSGFMASSKGAKMERPKVHRVTMNIPEGVYQTAKGLDQRFAMGYQNVLKAAMVLGMKNLSQQIGR